MLHPVRTAERKRVARRGCRHPAMDPDTADRATRRRMEYCPVCMLLYPQVLRSGSCCGHPICYDCACSYASRHCVLPTSTAAAAMDGLEPARGGGEGKTGPLHYPNSFCPVGSVHVLPPL